MKSFAITSWEIMAGQEPSFKGIDTGERKTQKFIVYFTEIIKLVCSGARPAKIPVEQCPEEIWDQVIVPSWETDPHSRPTFSQLSEILSRLL